MQNVIARGTDAGIRAEDDGVADGDALVIKVDRANYSTVVETEPEADVQLASAQTAAPLFVNADPAVRDFHQLASSPTIDAGNPFASTGMVDFDGQARVMGCALDIGGDEFSATCPVPSAPTLPPTPITPSTAPTPKKKKCKKKGKKRRSAAAAKKRCKKKKR
jgi:hypothetical protein